MGAVFSRSRTNPVGWHGRRITLMSDELLDTHAAAKRLGLASSTLRAWRTRTPRSDLSVRTQGPRFIRIGRTVRYRAHELDRWLRAQDGGSSPAAELVAQFLDRGPANGRNARRESAAMRATLERLLKFAEERAVGLADLAPADLREFLGHEYYAAGSSHRAREIAGATVRAFFTWLVDDGQLITNPTTAKAGPEPKVAVGKTRSRLATYVSSS